MLEPTNCERPLQKKKNGEFNQTELMLRYSVDEVKCVTFFFLLDWETCHIITRQAHRVGEN